MLIKMMKEMKACPDGIHEKTFEKGESYDMDSSLSEVFLKERWARKAQPKKAEKTAEELQKEQKELELAELIKKEEAEAKVKADAGAGENKALQGPGENKQR